MTRSVGSRLREHALLLGGERYGHAAPRPNRTLIGAAKLPSTPSSLSGLEFADDPARRAYWRQYITLGAAISILVGAISLLYGISTPEGAHRRTLYILVAVVIAISGVVLVLGRKVVGTTWHLPFLLIWSTASMTFITVAVALDGGTSSQLFWLLVLPVVYAGIGYPLVIVRAIVIAAQMAVFAMMVIGHDWSGTAWYQFGFVASFNVFILAAAKNRHTFESGEREMTAIATHDGLTGCLNRGAFLDRLDAECNRARRYHRPVSLLIVDVDRFKDINDTLGHQAGDEALRALAASFVATVRAADSLGRIGGDEFAVLLPESDSIEAAASASRLTAAARATPSPTPLTISVGAATQTGTTDEPASLMARADAALYEAKAAGRDCVVSAAASTECGAGISA